ARSATSAGAIQAPDKVAAVASSASRRRPTSVSRAPSAASAWAIAAPIPDPPPVTTACMSFSRILPSQRRFLLGCAFHVARELAYSVPVTRRHRGTAIVVLRRRAQCPHRIDHVRTPDRDQIGAAGGEDRI